MLNLGAGVDTRAFWLECLKGVSIYIEVDTKTVNDKKSKILEDLQAKGLLMKPMCERKIISIDFSKESTKDLPKHGFDQEIPTCWILEGLVMYLKKEDNVKLMDEMSELSAVGSYIIVNFAAKNPACEPEDFNK